MDSAGDYCPAESTSCQKTGFAQDCCPKHRASPGRPEQASNDSFFLRDVPFASDPTSERSRGCLRLVVGWSLGLGAIDPQTTFPRDLLVSPRLGGTRLSRPPPHIGLSIPLRRARQACPSDPVLRRDLLVRSAKYPLMVHRTSAGTINVPLRAGMTGMSLRPWRDALVASA